MDADDDNEMEGDQEQTTDHGQAPQSSSKKRPKEDDTEAEDLLGQICNKLNSLTTADSNEQKIDAFVTVLACTKDEAIFFLESADWSVEAAVGLWLENGQDSYSKRSRYTDLAFDLDPSLQSSSASGQMFGHRHMGGIRPPRKYVARPVIIEGLDPSWTAWVSRSTGVVYFKHEESGHMQEQVPPGFADDPNYAFAATTTSAMGGDNGDPMGSQGNGSSGQYNGLGHEDSRRRRRHNSQTDAVWMADVNASSGGGGGGGGDEDHGKMEDGDGLDVDSVTAAVATGSDVGDNGNDDTFSMEVRGSEFVDVPTGSIGSSVNGGGSSGNVGRAGFSLGSGLDGGNGGGMSGMLDDAITSQETSPSSAV